MNLAFTEVVPPSRVISLKHQAVLELTVVSAMPIATTQ